MDWHHALCHVVVGVLIKRWFSFSLVTLWTTEENMKQKTQPVFDQDLDLQAFWTQCAKAVADPGFPRRGRQLPRAVRQSIILQIFWRKLHENERISTERRRAFPASRLGSATEMSKVLLSDETILII